MPWSLEAKWGGKSAYSYCLLCLALFWRTAASIRAEHLITDTTCDVAALFRALNAFAIGASNRLVVRATVMVRAPVYIRLALASVAANVTGSGASARVWVLLILFAVVFVGYTSAVGFAAQRARSAAGVDIDARAAVLMLAEAICAAHPLFGASIVADFTGRTHQPRARVLRLA